MPRLFFGGFGLPGPVPSHPFILLRITAERQFSHKSGDDAPKTRVEETFEGGTGGKWAQMAPNFGRIHMGFFRPP